MSRARREPVSCNIECHCERNREQEQWQEGKALAHVEAEPDGIDVEPQREDGASEQKARRERDPSHSGLRARLRARDSERDDGCECWHDQIATANRPRECLEVLERWHAVIAGYERTRASVVLAQKEVAER